jgi:hypothetical protein
VMCQILVVNDIPVWALHELAYRYHLRAIESINLMTSHAFGKSLHVYYSPPESGPRDSYVFLSFLGLNHQWIHEHCGCGVWLRCSCVELPVLVRPEQVFPNLRQHLQTHFRRESTTDIYSETYAVF